jgi:hypothetical protein
MQLHSGTDTNPRARVSARIMRTGADSSLSLKRGIGKEEVWRNHGGLSSQQVLEAVPVPSEMQKDEFIEAWSDWIEYRLECGRIYRWVTTIRCFSRMMKFCHSLGAERATKAIDRSIQLGYRGIFEDGLEQKKQKAKVDKWDGL